MVAKSEQTVVHATKRTKKLTWIPFLCMIALRNKTVAHTFPSFELANGRPCQERLLRSRSWFCHHGNVTSHFSSLSRGVCLLIVVHLHQHCQRDIMEGPYSDRNPKHTFQWTDLLDWIQLQSTEWQNVDIVSLNERCLDRVSKLSDVSFFSASGLPNFRCPIPVSLS